MKIAVAGVAGDQTAPDRGLPDLLQALVDLRPLLQEEAAASDRDAGFPAASLDRLRKAGLLVATVPRDFGGLGLCGPAGARDLFRLLHDLGACHLSVGRIFEAHVNALELVRHYGTTAQMAEAAAAARAGALFALWVTDPPDGGLRWQAGVDGSVLAGEKWFCSAAGHAQRALITAATPAGAQMLLITVAADRQVTDRGIALAGMRAATTGSVDLTGVAIEPSAIIGTIGDYLREPVFSAAAWRNYAVILGGLSALIDLTRAALHARGRADDPFQRMRFGEAVIAYETGRLWLLEAAIRAEAASGAGEDAIAYVNLARTAVEACCLDAIGLVQRSLGLSAFITGAAAERIARDLGTYLRQPAPDEALGRAARYCLDPGWNWRDGS